MKQSQSDLTTRCKIPLNSIANGQRTQWGLAAVSFVAITPSINGRYFFNLLPVAALHNQPPSTLEKVASTTGCDVDSDGGEERTKMLPRLHDSTHQLEWQIKRSMTRLPILF